MRYAALEGLGLLSQADLVMLARVETSQAKRDLQQLETAAKTTGNTLDKDLGQPVSDVDKGMSRMSGASLALAGVLAGVVLSSVNVVSVAIQNAAKAVASFVADSIELAGKFSPAWTQSLAAVSNSWDGLRQQIGNFFVLSPSLNAAINSIAQSLQSWSNELVGARDVMLPFITTLQAAGAVLLSIAEAFVSTARATAQFWALMPGGLGDVGKDTVRALDNIQAGINRVRDALVAAGLAAAGAFMSGGGANDFPWYGPDSSLAGGPDKAGKGKKGDVFGIGPGSGLGWFGIDPVGFQTAGEAIRSSILSVSEVMAPLGTQITLMNQQLREMRDNTAGSAQMFYDFVPALETSAVQMSITSAVTDQMIGAFEQLVLTGNFSARSFVKAVGLQVAGVLGKLAIEAFTRAQMEQALALASAAAGDYRGSVLHTAAAVSFLNTARAAGIGAAVAGAGALAAGLTDGGGDGGGGGGRGRGRGAGATPTAATASPAAMQQNVTIYLDGQGFIQDPTAFAQTLQDSLDKVNKRRGRG